MREGRRGPEVERLEEKEEGAGSALGLTPRGSGEAALHLGGRSTLGRARLSEGLVVRGGVGDGAEALGEVGAFGIEFG